MRSFDQRFNLIDKGDKRLVAQRDMPLLCPCCSIDLLTQTAVQDHHHFVSQVEKANLSKLSQFRMVIPNLLYVIGMPRKFGREEIARQTKFFGQFGKIQRVLVNSMTKDFYE